MWLGVTFWALSVRLLCQGGDEGRRLLCQVHPVWEETSRMSEEYLLDREEAGCQVLGTKW